MSATAVCTGCSQTKPLCDFTGFEAKGTIKQYRTCNSCRAKPSQRKKNTKKRSYEDTNSLEIVEEDTDSLEVVEVTDFFDYTMQLLSMYTTQLENEENEENIPPFHFECKVDISTLNNSAKEASDYLVELIEEVDEFSWTYV
jgi:hypothetical protein